MAKSEVKKNGGARPGAGRKKGSKSKASLEKDRIYAEYKNKIMHHADQIFHQQKAMAFGSYECYMVEYYKDEVTGKVKKSHIHITDPELIQDILDNPNLKQGDNYVLVRTVEPDKYTLDSMLDRAFGKATQHVEQKTMNLTPQDLIDDLDNEASK